MTYYGGKNLADSFRTVRKNTLAIAEEIPEDQYDFRAAPEVMSVGEMLAHLAISPMWQIDVHGQQIAHFLGRMNEYKDRNGSALDNTIVLFGSGASTTHNSHNLPTLLAGGANMGLKHGIYWRKEDTRMSNVYISILRSMEIEQEVFADSTGTLSGSIFGRV